MIGKSMDSVPTSREEFERNLFLMAEKMRAGKFHINSGLVTTIDSISRVKKLPNGRVDFLTVDEAARATANTLAMSMTMLPMQSIEEPNTEIGE